MGLIFDTCILIGFERNEERVSEIIQRQGDEPFGISVITIAELLHGVERADTAGRRIRRSDFVEKIIELFPIFDFDVNVARRYAAVWADAAKAKRQIGAHDLILAATALTLDFTIITTNIRDFEWISSLKVKRLP